MKKVLYLECNAGISGDMLVGALLDLGADCDVLVKALKSIPVYGFTFSVDRVKKAGIDCCDFKVILDDALDNHDHDMEYLHGAETDSRGDSDDERHGGSLHIDLAGTTAQHHREHGHTTADAGVEAGHISLGTVFLQDKVRQTTEHEQAHIHRHHHRGLREIRKIIAAVDMTPAARAKALAIFDVIAAAEAKAHNVDPEEVHFHEVGAVDSIVDVIAVAVCAENLQPDEVVITGLCEGRGTVRCQHGYLAVPVPAVVNIAATHGLPLTITEHEGEFVTPTGAAAAAVLRTSSELPRRFLVKKVGYGAGKRSYSLPSLLRAFMLEPLCEDAEINDPLEDAVVKLETDMDDCSGEILGHLVEKLLRAGAKDVYYQPVFMKKNRPGWQLNVICDELTRMSLAEIIFRETTTIGIRYGTTSRMVLQREQRRIMTAYGDVSVKVCRCGEAVYCYPEYEEAARIAAAEKLPLAEVYEAVRAGCRAAGWSKDGQCF